MYNEFVQCISIFLDFFTNEYEEQTKHDTYIGDSFVMLEFRMEFYFESLYCIRFSIPYFVCTNIEENIILICHVY